MEKKKYTQPAYEILLLEKANIITESSVQGEWEAPEIDFGTKTVTGEGGSIWNT